MIPRPGDVVIVDGKASVQFADTRGLLFRVISVSDRSTYEGWTWLQGYSINSAGVAIERREIFVRHDGLRHYQARPVRPSVGSGK
ncbi:hypothetical protein GCM10010168_76980 [Actinoplanes ianthinogenes]|uniref:S26 family signal peptidase n=1 Tax=Actinoplanes ianthinogenes TaxID=122358 RepID=A0ABN6CT46_9ACTN|nr:hypothetical protein [Actinoplanes ianthinogenes]BCJ48376.1 hypothetical protein Aiant_90330 [Actinoplanes ianthinogenes]GGR46803.1 hypothetical protein GCM10010168_76980 [Actinoplanes ianthinogenes]